MKGAQHDVSCYYFAAEDEERAECKIPSENTYDDCQSLLFLQSQNSFQLRA